MFKYLLSVLGALILIFLSVPQVAWATNNSFVTVVNPVRGGDFWDLKEKPYLAVEGQSKILKDENIPATWLVRFDAWQDSDVLSRLKSLPSSDELGIFLEVTPSWTSVSGIEYRLSGSWHSASSAFLTGYSTSEREKLIETGFEGFKKTFGYYPQSVGAWYIDSYSLKYMQQKYGVSAALIVADQYTTDSYQIWGQFWSTPYYPSGKNTLMPAQSVDEKLPVVVTQWAARDPVNGYGPGVEESTYSVQANDYIDYHQLDISYFERLVDLYTKQNLAPFGQLVIGLENSYSWERYGSEYASQISKISQKRKIGQLSAVTMTDFSKWYSQKFPNISPTQVMVSTDPLNTSYSSVWFMNPYYRAGWFYNGDGSVFRDVRPYTEGRAEQCYLSPCDKLSFATFALHALDDITRKQKLVVDSGSVNDLSVRKDGDNYTLTYTNAAGRKRKIEFMPRDISIDGKVSSIDSFILNAVKGNTEGGKLPYPSAPISADDQSFGPMLIKTGKFLYFLLMALFIPGYILARSFKNSSLLGDIFLSLTIGLVNLTLVSCLANYLRFSWIVYLYLALSVLAFFYFQHYREIISKIKKVSLTWFDLILVMVIIFGTVFQSLAMWRSGWIYDFGLGFWGPIGHDGIWHQALIYQLTEQVPPENPGFSGTLLNNYHYFYDLLVATTYRFWQIPVLDLLYRFYPLLLSVLMGIGTYILGRKLLGNRWSTLISLYFVYFAGSFGWIVEFLRERHFGGESAFWANQPVSANLNPPFAISLVILIALIEVVINYLHESNWKRGLVLVLLAGALIEFKVYAGIIALGGLMTISVIQLFIKKKFSLMKVSLGALVLSLAVFLPQNSRSGGLVVFAPFWFIHSMIDFTDRVGWERLSLARQMAPIQGNWLKFYGVEALALVLFVVGNLGTRFFTLFSLITFVKKKLWRDEVYLFILVMGLLSLSIPILFIQKGNPWNTIQFLYYFIYFVAIFTGATIIFLWRKLPRYLSYVLISIVLVITPINAVVTFTSYLSASSPSRLTGGEWNGLSFLRTAPHGVVLTYPFDKNLRKNFNDPFPLPIYETSNYVAAFSGKPTFIEDEIQQEIFQNDYKKRLVMVTDFFRGRDSQWSENFLRTNNIRYVYLPKVFGVDLNEEVLKLRKIYSNEEVTIFQTMI